MVWIGLKTPRNPIAPTEVLGFWGNEECLSYIFPAKMWRGNSDLRVA